MMNLIDLSSAQAPEKNRDEFLEALRMLAHKLSQPLTSVRGSIEVALMEEVGENECRRVLEQSLEEFHRMAKILEVLREVIEIEAANEELQAVSWMQCVEECLKEAASPDENCSLQVVSDRKNEVWVKAIPQHLDMVTCGLMRWVSRAGSGKRLVQVALSVRGEYACLSIYDESSPSDAGRAPGTDQKHFSEAGLEPEDLQWWIIRRVVEHMGGSLKINRAPTTGSCCEVRLPLAPSGVAGRVRPSER